MGGKVDAAMSAVVVAPFCELHVKVAQQRLHGLPQGSFLRAHLKEVWVFMFRFL